MKMRVLTALLAFIVPLCTLPAADPAAASPPGSRPATAALGAWLGEPGPGGAAPPEAWQAAAAARPSTPGAAATPVRPLVILVEFGGPDTFTWTAGSSGWDPLGLADKTEAVPNPLSPTPGDCSKIVTATTEYTYSGPSHNQIPRPISTADVSGQSVWTPDFSRQWFDGMLFGGGVTFDYTREDGSAVHEDYTGKSLRDYYLDMSGGRYDVRGDVVGWVRVPHSSWWYGADPCPGARSVDAAYFARDGAIPGAGNARSLVIDALDAVNASKDSIPGFDWKNYDQDGDGFIDRLWIVHAGYGEEEDATLLNRTTNRESAVMSQVSVLPGGYEVAAGISAGTFALLPENVGIGAFTREVARVLALPDQRTYGLGTPSIGFWSPMSDNATGSPRGFMPAALDAYSLDQAGWLEPRVIVDPNQVYEVTVGQASDFPGGEGVHRGVQILLPEGQYPQRVAPWGGSYYWWGGAADLANGTMTTRSPISLAGATTASLTFDLSYDIEPQWDFLWVQVSEDGVTWPVTQTLTNANTKCTHDAGWIGANYGFPGDLCAAGIGGFSGSGLLTPAIQTLDLARFSGKSVYLRFWYMTDWGTLGAGPFVDNVAVTVNGATVFSDNAESGDAKWTYASPWERNPGYLGFPHAYYLQWRNVDPQTGGYDGLALGGAHWAYGPANTGLLVSYNNNHYRDNEVYAHLQDPPSFGAKGLHLAVDAHPEPFRDPDLAASYPNAIANLAAGGQMRDAPFSLKETAAFAYPSAVTAGQTNTYAARPSVSTFTDAAGYAPGVEYVRRGALPCTVNSWFDKQWDASVVLPSRGPYTTKATGGAVTTSTGIRMRGLVNPAGSCQSSWYGYWYVPFADAAVGNTGNPGDSGVAYGWRVQIMSQTDQRAALKIWNTRHFGALTADRTVVNKSGTVRYAYALKGNQGSPLSLFVCVDLDTARVAYVDGSISGGALPLTASCDATGGAPAAAATGGAPIVAIGWVGYVPNGGSAAFGFDVKATAEYGTIAHEARLYRDGAFHDSFPAQPVTITPAGIPATAGFTVSATTVKTAEPVQFTNGSTGAADLAYLWDFGDGATSTLESPAHAWARAGVHTVTLTTTNLYGADSVQKAITVLPVVAAASAGDLDGWVLESAETSGRGGTFNARATTVRIGDDRADRQYVGIFSFDTSAVPDDAVVTSAKLRFRRQRVTGANPHATHGALTLDVVKGAFSRRRALGATDFRAPATVTAAATIPARPVSGWYSKQLGARALTAVNKMGLTQFRLRFAKDDDDDAVADFLSVYGGDAAAASRPVLEVGYRLP